MIHDEDQLQPLMLKLQTTVRTFNILSREGVQTVGAFLGLTRSTVLSYRNSNEKVANEVALLQDWIMEHRSSPEPTNVATETQTSITVRLLSWKAWWEGHDAVCPDKSDCIDHENPYEKG